MGMPACHITSTTAHGGTVILGFPTVLIGFMPASRIGDMHVCPMFTGPVPHVGGPFTLGSPTVLVGFMPQSRVTDMLVCVGPPDVAIMGCMTVLVGMAGAGGAGGASAGAGAMGVPSVAVPPAAVEAAAAQPKAQVQADGTVKTSAPAGQSLPPVAMQQEGWPPLQPEATVTFEAVQPATLLPGTTLYAVTDADSDGGNSFFDVAPPSPADAASAPEEASWNAASHVQVSSVPPGEGVKVWAGKPAGGSKGDGELRVWAPPDAMSGAPMQRFRMPGAKP